jgi:hypothetical protein
MNTPLDHYPEVKTEIALIRRLPIILEIVPMMATLIGIVLKNNTIITISISAWAFIYIGLGWYIFKRKNYTMGSVVFAVITSIIIACGVLAVGFQLMDWQGRTEIKIATLPMLLLGFVTNVVWYFLYKNNKQELGFNRKMMIRLAGLILVLLYMP